MTNEGHNSLLQGQPLYLYNRDLHALDHTIRSLAVILCLSPDFRIVENIIEISKRSSFHIDNTNMKYLYQTPATFWPLTPPPPPSKVMMTDYLCRHQQAYSDLCPLDEAFSDFYDVSQSAPWIWRPQTLMFHLWHKTLSILLYLKNWIKNITMIIYIWARFP